MLEFWSDLPSWLRFLSALVVIVVGVLAFLLGFVRAGAGMFGMGIVMIAVGGKSRSEKNGYHF